MVARMDASIPGISRKKNAGCTDDGRFRNTIKSDVAGEEFPGIAGVRPGENAREREDAPGQSTGMGEA